MERDRVVAVVSHSWFGIAIGKVEIRGRSAREKLQDEVPEDAWPVVRAMLNAGVLRSDEFLWMWRRQALEWGANGFVRPHVHRVFDYAAFALHWAQVGNLIAVCVCAAAWAWLALPALLIAVLNKWYLAPHRNATRVLASMLNTASQGESRHG